MRMPSSSLLSCAMRSMLRLQAFPLDELDPVHCTGRGVDRDNPENINVNDVLGNYSLGLIDSLDTIALMVNRDACLLDVPGQRKRRILSPPRRTSAFHTATATVAHHPDSSPTFFSQGDRDRFVYAVDQTIKTVSFDQDSTVQVFEVTIRAMGGLLSAHLIAKSGEFGMRIDDYDDELLWLARDLGVRLLPAFDSASGIPFSDVNLGTGAAHPPKWTTQSSLAEVGTIDLSVYHSGVDFKCPFSKPSL